MSPKETPSAPTMVVAAVLTQDEHLKPRPIVRSGINGGIWRLAAPSQHGRYSMVQRSK